MSIQDEKFHDVDGSPLNGMIGSSDAMKRVFQLSRLSANSHASVLLMGEIGTGKEQVAAAIHQLGPRREGPYIRINCGALDERLLESELFGHVRGSFVDAVSDRTGRLEAADGGTLFLNEINSTSATLQAKLLRFLQDGVFERIGDTQSIPASVRVIAASNSDLSKDVAEGVFREDLYWGLNVLPISLPPLRRRSEDIEALVLHFLLHFSDVHQKSVPKVAPDAMKALQEYAFPGNVRELKNYIERAVVLTRGDMLTTSLLPIAVTGDTTDAASVVFRPTDDEALIREYVYSQIQKSESTETNLFKKIVGPVEKELLLQVLDSCNQTQTKAARALGVNRNTLYKKLVDFGLANSKTNQDE